MNNITTLSISLKEQDLQAIKDSIHMNRFGEFLYDYVRTFMNYEKGTKFIIHDWTLSNINNLQMIVKITE